MVRIGDFNRLEVTRLSRGGAFLSIGLNKQQEVYLPKKETPSGLRRGDKLKVFLFNDSKQHLAATTGTPLAKVGEFASLRVKEITQFAAFLEWGISKDLFLPRKYWPRQLQRGESVVVYLKLDYEKSGILGTGVLDEFFSSETGELRENQKVELLVFSSSRLGYEAVVDQKYRGLLYRDETFEEVDLGDVKTGYIKKVRDDGLVDVSLQPQGFEHAAPLAEELVLKALKRAGGFLPLHDKSAPEEVYRRLQISKKLFKKSIGVLYRRGAITIEKNGIRLN